MEQQSRVLFVDSLDKAHMATLQLGCTQANADGNLETTFYVLKVNG